MKSKKYKTKILKIYKINFSRFLYDFKDPIYLNILLHPLPGLLLQTGCLIVLSRMKGSHNLSVNILYYI